MERIEGKVWMFGDDINTDVILPGQYLKLSGIELAEHAMEGIDPGFAAKVKSGDILFAGKNFGCGSSRESAPEALKYVGISAVICRFAARIFYRNAMNVGLPVIELSDDFPVSEGDHVQIDLQNGMILNQTNGANVQAQPLPEHLLRILRAGGLVPYLEEQLSTKKEG